jgi:proline dehydrogenase
MNMFNTLIANSLPYFPKKFIWVFSKKYIAGETIEEALLASSQLNQKGISVTIDLLGEFISSLDQAEANKAGYLEIIRTFSSAKIDGNFSLKPTSFGLLIDKEVCYRNIREIVALAASLGSFIRIDMEDSQCVDDEIELYNRLRAEFPMAVGLVIQAYLKRTYADVEAFVGNHTASTPVNFRLCKGIYIEPAEIAYKERQAIVDNYIKTLDYLLANGVYVGIATHDRKVVDAALQIIKKYGLGNDRYEFQMLYGVTPELRKELVDAGHRLRVYVPFGKDWFGYSTRRLKENPKIASHIIKSLFVRG